ncbi:hypothetical protein M0805_007731 [Coniferiporia weirii]|nr:hypothetical protein M0805_007731 [Coniferiporia weirii]
MASEIVPKYPIPSTALQDSEELLKRALSTLSHLNLTGRIVVDFTRPCIARGSFGEVHLSSCNIRGRGRVKVAVKRLLFNLQDEPQIIKILAKEIYILSKLFHPNIVPLIGFLPREGDYPAIVSEWMDNGSVMQYLRAHPECDLLHLVLGMAEGLAYLHEKDVVHADIKPANVLVNSLGEAMICDFGLSRVLNASQAGLAGNSTRSHGPGGTFRYMAYELLAASEEYTKHTKATDVWSFGMTLYEILVGEVPYAHIRNDYGVVGAVSSKILPTRPISLNTWPEHRQELLKICNPCWTLEPQLRVSMSDVVRDIEGLSGTSPPYLLLHRNPFKISNKRYPTPKMSLRMSLVRLSHLNLTEQVNASFSGPIVNEDTRSEIYSGICKFADRGEVKIAIMLPDPGIPAIVVAKGISMWAKLVHPNIAPLLGFIVDKSGFPEPVSEWMDSFSVLSYVKEHPKCNIVHLVVGIARGLEYLHKNDIVHAEIRSDNISVNSSGNAVICGFHYSRAASASQALQFEDEHSDLMPQFNWMARELFTHGSCTKESDVWAFGMTVYELLTRRRPRTSVLSIIQGILPVRPASFNTWPEDMQKIWGLCEACWAFNPQLRITMEDVVERLESLE